MSSRKASTASVVLNRTRQRGRRKLLLILSSLGEFIIVCCVGIFPSNCTVFQFIVTHTLESTVHYFLFTVHIMLSETESHRREAGRL